MQQRANPAGHEWHSCFQSIALCCPVQLWRLKCTLRAWPLPWPQGTLCRANQARASMNRDIFTIWGKAGRIAILGIRSASKLRISIIHWYIWAPTHGCTALVLKLLCVQCCVSQPGPHHMAYVSMCPSLEKPAALGSSCMTQGAFPPWPSCSCRKFN